MEVGIGLPSGIATASGALMLDWARRADAGPFSSLGVIDRLVYHNYEPMVSLAAAAAVTQRVRLMTVVLLAMLRNGGILAKEAASVDALSGGRLTLGMGVGRREDDFKAAPAAIRRRGRRFEEQLALMRGIWSGQPLAEDVGPIGPPPARPGGPEVLIGGTAPAALHRAGRMGDGYIAGTARDPAGLRELFDAVEEAWKAEGRSGRPRLAAVRYYALGPDALERGAVSQRDYYTNIGSNPEDAVRNMITSPEAIKGLVQGCSDIGMDELVFLPSIPELDQVDRLAEVVG